MTSPRADGPAVIRISIAFTETEPPEPESEPHPLDLITGILLAHFGPGAPARPPRPQCTCHGHDAPPLDAEIHGFLIDLG